MGITYQNKPDFIERLIEVGSQHFFQGLGNLSFAAAEAEIGEHIGVHRSALEHAERSLWHVRKTLELYTGMINSLSNLEVSKNAKSILSDYDFTSLKNAIEERRTVNDDETQWHKFVESSRRVDPVGTMKDFVAEVEAIVAPLETLVQELTEGQMNPTTLHQCIAAFVSALNFGQYIAEFNRDTKERFAA